MKIIDTAKETLFITRRKLDTNLPFNFTKLDNKSICLIIADQVKVNVSPSEVCAFIKLSATEQTVSLCELAYVPNIEGTSQDRIAIGLPIQLTLVVDFDATNSSVNEATNAFLLITPPDAEEEVKVVAMWDGDKFTGVH